MKVLLANSEKGLRGGEHQTAQLARGLVGSGVAVRVAVARGSQLEEELRGAVPVHPLSFEAFPVTTPQRLRRIIREHQPDILHAQTSRSHTHLWLARMLLSGAPPLVVSRRVAFRPRNGLKYRRGVDHFIPISRAAASGLSAIGVESERMTIVPSGIDIRSFREARGDERLREGWGLQSRCTLIGTVAALEREKGLVTLLEAAAGVIAKRDDCRFVLIGEGTMGEEISERIRRLGIGEQVVVSPGVAPLRNILPLFDLYVQPSIEEGLSTALIAAAAAGLAIVASDTGGIPEVLGRDGGILVTPGDAALLEAAIERALDDDALRLELSKRAAQRAEAFDIGAMVGGTISVYRSILGKRAV